MWRAEDRKDCDRWREMLDAHLDGELTAAEVPVWEEHLEACVACREELRLAEEVHQELRSLPMFDAPEISTPEAGAGFVADAGVARFPSPSAQPAAGGWRSWAAAAGLGVLVLTIFWWLASGAGEARRDLARLSDEPASSAPQDLRLAEEEARLAFAYISRAGQRAGMQVRDTVLREAVLEPVVETLARSLTRADTSPAEGSPSPREGAAS
ncbi:MAG: zf-HC2 domain-containing protein [Acidobacteriota bacterium]